MLLHWRQDQIYQQLIAVELHEISLLKHNTRIQVRIIVFVVGIFHFGFISANPWRGSGNFEQVQHRPTPTKVNGG